MSQTVSSDPTTSDPTTSDVTPGGPPTFGPLSDEPAEAPPEGPRWEGPEFFFRTDMPARKYVLRMAVVSFVPSIVLALILSATGILTEGNAPEFQGPPLFLFFGIVVISPVVETLLMAGFLYLFRFFIERPVPLAIASCILWAILHSLMAPMWGVIVAWPFFVFSCAYLAWRRVSWAKGILVASSIHALHNLLPALTAIFAGV